MISDGIIEFEKRNIKQEVHFVTSLTNCWGICLLLMGDNTQVSTFLFTDGSKYEGEWKMSEEGLKVREGFGSYITGPEKYVGTWKDDKISGSGVYNFSSGAVYEGEFLNGYPS